MDDAKYGDLNKSFKCAWGLLNGISIFSIYNDFILWKVKMKVILIQQKCANALRGETKMSITLT